MEDQVKVFRITALDFYLFSFETFQALLLFSDRLLESRPFFRFSEITVVNVEIPLLLIAFEEI